MMVALKERIAGGIVAAMHRPHEPKSRSTEEKKCGTQQKAASIGTVVLFDWIHVRGACRRPAPEGHQIHFIYLTFSTVIVQEIDCARD